MPWGQVCYQIADLGAIDSMVYDGWLGGNNLSELMGTFLERVVGDDAFEFYGLQFPILVKVMKTSGRQPLQINAADDVAEERYDSFGKTSFWYVKEASEDASLFLGLNRDVEAGEFYRRCKEGTAWEILNEIHPKAGEFGAVRGGYGLHLGLNDSWRYRGDPGTNGEIITFGRHAGQVLTHGNPPARAMYETGKEIRARISAVAAEVFG